MTGPAHTRRPHALLRERGAAPTGAEGAAGEVDSAQAPNFPRTECPSAFLGCMRARGRAAAAAAARCAGVAGSAQARAEGGLKLLKRRRRQQLGQRGGS